MPVQLRQFAKWVPRGISFLGLLSKVGVSGASMVLGGILAVVSGVPAPWNVVIFAGVALVVFAVGGSALGHLLTRKYRTLAADLRAWCDDLTARLHYHRIARPPATPSEDQTDAFREDYYREAGLRKRGLLLIDRGIDDGVMNEELRRRFHMADDPAKFWELTTVLYEDHIRPWQPHSARASD